MQETRIMFAYSAMKKKAKRIPLYSVIQPATSSLSASGRSKGRRFVSATAEMTYTTKATVWVTGNHHQMPAPCPMPMTFQFRIDPACFSAIVTMLSEPARIRTLMIASPTISYELNVGLAIISVLILAGSLSMVTIAEKQAGSILNWNVIGMGHGAGIWWWFPVTQTVAFVVYVISAVAETNRLPFDLPEAESELVAGWMTEYSGMRFAFFFMAEYANMILVSCIASVLFLGGYHAPYPGTLLPANLAWIEGVAWFTVKLYGFLFLFFWLRATLPRLRYDQLMRFGWKVMRPLALGNIVITAIVVYFLRD